MKLLAIYAAGAAVVALVVFVIMFGARWFNAHTVQSKLISPKKKSFMISSLMLWEKVDSPSADQF